PGCQIQIRPRGNPALGRTASRETTPVGTPGAVWYTDGTDPGNRCSITARRAATCDILSHHSGPAWSSSTDSFPQNNPNKHRKQGRCETPCSTSAPPTASPHPDG